MSSDNLSKQWYSMKREVQVCVLYIVEFGWDTHPI